MLSNMCFTMKVPTLPSKYGIRSHTLISKGIGEHENFPYHPAGTHIIRTRGVDLFWRSGL